MGVEKGSKRFVMRRPPTSLEKATLMANFRVKTGTNFKNIISAAVNTIHKDFGQEYLHITEGCLLSHPECLKHSWGDYSVAMFAVSFLESDKSFSERLARFQTELDAYKIWQKENAVAIKKYELDKKNKEREKIKSRRIALEAKLDTLKKKVNHLQLKEAS